MGGVRDDRDLQHNAPARQDLRNERIAQVLFFESDEVCEVSYADRKGKYQSRIGVTLPKMQAVSYLLQSPWIILFRHPRQV
jgi:hypothetical protein